MAMRYRPYDYRIRQEMRSGDVIAFSGNSFLSNLIRSWSPDVSHVGIVLQVSPRSGDPSRFFNWVVDAQMGFGEDRAWVNGVVISLFSKRLDEYDGDVWWLPLRRDLRLDRDSFFDFLIYEMQGASFDLSGAFARLVLERPEEADLSEVFCSELVAEALDRAGAVRRLNASQVSPSDLCRWKIYEDTYYMLKKVGDSKEISGYNMTNIPTA